MKFVALAGGVGGAKLADGLAKELLPDKFRVIVNTGDDFTHFGLRICPDLDTVCYTLAELANPATGWGRQQESWTVYEGVSRLDGPDWFRLGDKDLATHLERTRRLNEGFTLSEVVKHFCDAWGISHPVMPMSDDAISTIVQTVEAGDLSFQEYFVKNQCKPVVKGFMFKGISEARPAPGVIAAIEEADCVILCPSNPWVSIDPILAITGIRETMRGKTVLAVSPIIGGKTVKGPAAKMFQEQGIMPSCTAIAQHYRGLITTLVIDHADQEEAKTIEELGIKTLVTNILMMNQSDRRRLAQEVLFACSQDARG